MSTEFTVNPETCPRCSQDGERVLLQGGECPECGWTPGE